MQLRMAEGAVFDGWSIRVSIIPVSANHNLDIY